MPFFFCERADIIAVAFSVAMEKEEGLGRGRDDKTGHKKGRVGIG